MPIWHNQTQVEAWRARVAQTAPDLPTDFLLAWIDEESGGDWANDTESAGFAELGLFQVSWGEAQTMGWTYDRFQSTNVTPENSLANGIALVRKHCQDADDLLAKYHLSWEGPDYGNLVKMMHALPHEVTGDGMGYPGAFANYAADHDGAGPPSWADARAYGSSRYSSMYDNAEYAGQFWAGGPSGNGSPLGLALAAIGLFTLLVIA